MSLRWEEARDGRRWDLADVTGIGDARRREPRSSADFEDREQRRRHREEDHEVELEERTDRHQALKQLTEAKTERYEAETPYVIWSLRVWVLAGFAALAVGILGALHVGDLLEALAYALEHAKR
jgi:hypothetical protein